MATEKRNEQLTTYTGDVHALIAHGIEAIERQQKNLADVRHQDAKTTIAELLRVLRAQESAVGARYQALGGRTTQPVKDAVAAVAGVAAGVIDAVRRSETVKSIRDDYTFLSHLNVAWLLLHTTALALGDVETGILAERGYGEVARLIMHIDKVLPQLVVEELREQMQVAEVQDKTRTMVKAAWNREAPTMLSGAMPGGVGAAPRVTS